MLKPVLYADHIQKAIHDLVVTLDEVTDGIAAILSGLRFDPITSALNVITYEHHEIHEGKHFFVRDYQDLAINNVLDFTWLMPDGGIADWMHWTWQINTESETLWQVYEGAVVTNPLANVVTPYNNNRNSANVSATVMKYELQANLAAADADTDVSGATLLATGISGAGRDSGTISRDNEMIMQQDTLYCLRATANAAGYIAFEMSWYEHTNL